MHPFAPASFPALPSPPNAPAMRRGVIGLCLAVTMFTLDSSIVNIALPTWVTTFSSSLGQLQWVIISYLGAVVILLFPCAHLAARWGEKRVFLLGLGLFTVASMLCAVAWDLPSLIAFRLLQGCGAAALAALMNSLVTGLVPPSRLGFVLGLTTAFATVGTSLGPTLGGFLIGWMGWRAIFFINLPFGLLACLLIWRGVPALPPATSPQALRVGPLLRRPTVRADFLENLARCF